MTDAAVTTTNDSDLDEDSRYAAWVASRETRKAVEAPKPMTRNPFHFAQRQPLRKAA